MKIIPLEYDAYNRKFKLVHKEDAKWLSDGSVYLLMDFSSKDFANSGTGHSIPAKVFRNATLDASVAPDFVVEKA